METKATSIWVSVAVVLLAGCIVIGAAILANSNRYQAISGDGPIKIVDTKTGDVYLTTSTSSQGQHHWRRISLSDGKIIDE